MMVGVVAAPWPPRALTLALSRRAGPLQNSVIPAKAGIQRGGAIGALSPEPSLRDPDHGFCIGLAERERGRLLWEGVLLRLGWCWSAGVLFELGFLGCSGGFL